MVVAVGRRVHEICLKLARETRFVELGKACSVASWVRILHVCGCLGKRIIKANRMQVGRWITAVYVHTVFKEEIEESKKNSTLSGGAGWHDWVWKPAPTRGHPRRRHHCSGELEKLQV